MKVKQTHYLSLPDHRANTALYYFLARELEMRYFQLFVHLAFVELGAQDVQDSAQPCNGQFSGAQTQKCSG